MALDTATECLREAGLRVLLIETPGTEFLVEYGVQMGGLSFGHDDDRPTLLHLLEHLLSYFTSDKHPSASVLFDLFTRCAARTAAAVDDNKTSYELSGLMAHANVLLDVFANWLLAPRIPEELFKQEVEAALRETQEEADQAWRPFDERVQELLFPNHAKSTSSAFVLHATARATWRALVEFSVEYAQAARFLILACPDARAVYRQVLRPLLSQNTSRGDRVFEAQPAQPRGIAERGDRGSRGNAGSAFEIRVPNVAQSQVCFVKQVSLRSVDPDADILPHAVEFLRTSLFCRLRIADGLIYDLTAALDLDPTEPSLSTLTLSTFTDRPAAVTLAILQELAKLAEFGNVVPVIRNMAEREVEEKRADQSPQRYRDDYADDFIWQDHVVPNAERLRHQRDPENIKRVFKLCCSGWTMFFGYPAKPP